MDSRLRGNDGGAYAAARDARLIACGGTP